MLSKQKQVVEAFQRVQAFLVANPAPAPASYADPKQVLDDVVAHYSVAMPSIPTVQGRPSAMISVVRVG